MENQSAQPARRPVLTIKQFCEDYQISPAFFHKLSARGDGPRLMQVGRRVYVAAEDAAAWRESRKV